MNSKELRCTNHCRVDLVSNLQTVADVCNPPHSEKVIECRPTNSVCLDLGLVERGNVALSKNIALAACVCKCHNSNNVAVRCMNVNDHAVMISTGSVIGKCTGIAADQVIEEMRVGCVTGGRWIHLMCPTLRYQYQPI